MIIIVLAVLAFILLGLFFFRDTFTNLIKTAFMIVISVVIVLFVLVGGFITINNMITLYHNKVTKTVSWDQKCADKGGLPLRGINGAVCVDKNSVKTINP